MRQRSLLAAVLAAPLLLMGTAAAQAPDDFVLERTGGGLLERVEALDERLPKLGVQNILAQANREAEPGCRPNDVDGKPMPEAPIRSFCFNQGDVDTKLWYPQGVTTVADAQADERWGSKQAILVSWWDDDHQDDPDDNAHEKGARISFLDPDTNRYQHVLLAYPYINSAGDPSYEALTNPQQGDGKSIHAGGIVWYGNYLYVADSYRGIRVFDMRYIMDLKTADNGNTSDGNRIGLRGGTYYGHGYRYVMPQVDTWQQPGYPDETPACGTSGKAKLSFLSLDRSTEPDTLVSGEFCDPDDHAAPGQVGRWPLNESDGTPDDNGGTWQASDTYRLTTWYVQGATSWNGRWYLSSTGPPEEKDHALQAATAGDDGALDTGGESCRRVAKGVEDLSYWASRDELWTVSEYPGNRAIYALPTRPQDSSVGCNPAG